MQISSDHSLYYDQIKSLYYYSKQKYNYSMQDPYNYPFVQKDNTMYLSTITKNDFGTRTQYVRESTFQSRDINGTTPKVLIPTKPNDTNFNLSTYVEPLPDRFKHINKVSDSLRIDDIEGARPKAHEFRTNRIVDPLCPKYQLPKSNQISVDPGRTFIRNQIEVSDINQQKKPLLKQRGLQILRQPVQGSQPSHLTKYVQAKNRLQVKDINKDGIFETKRTTNPLNPQYKWRDQQQNPMKVNISYGQIQGNGPKKIYPAGINKPNMSLNTRDIEGTTANSTFMRSHFPDKRRQFRNYMQTKDIQKTNASSLKKGIQTIRQTNPLMPNYKFPGHSQIH